MRIVAIINQKGGCGKTTTSINLAACLGRLGQKTLLVDFDPQGHCGTGLAVPEEQIERTIFDALNNTGAQPTRLQEVIWQIATDFDLAPSNIKLAAFEQVFAGKPNREARLKEVLAQVSGNYEWCIIDCPPSVGLLTFNALFACDEVIVPVETGYFSLHGLSKMMQTLEVMRDECGRDILIRVLPTLYDTRTKLAREVLSELRAKFRHYLMESTVNFNTKLKEAASFGQPITEYDPGSRGYKDFVALARELMGHRPAEPVVATGETLSRPAELVQRAKQLAQLTNVQFGRGTVNYVQPAETAPAGNVMEVATTGKIGLPTDAHVAMDAAIVETTARAELVAPSTPSIFGDQPATSISALDEMERAFGDPRGHNHATGKGLLAGRISMAEIKSTQQKIDEFYGVKQQGDEVVFATRFENAGKVMIAGDFNGWSSVSTPMASVRKGDFRVKLPLGPGRYRYRFIVDGKWVTDPHNKCVETNQFGELNNIVEVG